MWWSGFDYVAEIRSLCDDKVMIMWWWGYDGAVVCYSHVVVIIICDDSMW